MHPICGFFAIAQAAQGVSAEAIPVQHMRPSKLLNLLNQIQPSTVLTADDEKGILYVRAGKETVDQYKSYASLFDIRPRKVKFSLEVDSQIDRENTSFESVIANNKKLAFTDAGMDMDVKVAARINDDNTITFCVEPTYKTKSSTIVVRVKSGESFTIGLIPDGTISFSKASDREEEKLARVNPPGNVLMIQDARGVQRGTARRWPVLRFKVAIQDDVPAAK